MVVDDDVGGGGIERRRLDDADRAELRRAGHAAGHVRPGLAGVTRDVHAAVVGAGPDQPFLLRRFGDREDRAPGLDARCCRR